MNRTGASSLREAGCLTGGEAHGRFDPGCDGAEAGPPARTSRGASRFRGAIRSDAGLSRPQSQKYDLVCAKEPPFRFTLRTLELSILHMDLMAGKFHRVSPPAEVNTTLEYRSPGGTSKEKKVGL